MENINPCTGAASVLRPSEGRAFFEVCTRNIITSYFRKLTSLFEPVLFFSIIPYVSVTPAQYVTSRYRKEGDDEVELRIGSGFRCLFDPWIRDPGPGWVNNHDPDPG
jgi:hypothetical protein